MSVRDRDLVSLCYMWIYGFSQYHLFTEILLLCFCGVFVKCYMTVALWIYILVFHFIPLIHVSVWAPVFVAMTL